MQADAELQLLAGPVADFEALHRLQQGQGHAGDLSGVFDAVSHREARHHHVGVADRLHLPIMGQQVRPPATEEMEREMFWMQENSLCYVFVI